MNNDALAMYRLFVPPQAVGASLVYFDLFNAEGTAHDMLVTACLPIVDGSVAVTGVVAVNLFLTHTSAVGTGGTAATYKGTSLTAATITPVPLVAGNMPLGITARLTPSGGATADAVLSQCSVFTEETNAGSYGLEHELVRRRMTDNPAIVCREGYGIRVVQGSVASVGNIGFDVMFQLRPK